MRLVDEHVDVVIEVGVLLDALELVDHRDDQAPSIGSEQLSQHFLRASAPDGDVLLLHLAQQPLHPTCELAFQLRAVNYDHDRRVAETLLCFQYQAGGREQCEGLAGPLGVPDEAASLPRLGTPLDDAVYGAALVLAQYGLARLAILHVEEDPVAQDAQKVRRLGRRTERRTGSFLPGTPSTAPCTGEIMFQVTPYQ